MHVVVIEFAGKSREIAIEHFALWRWDEVRGHGFHVWQETGNIYIRYDRSLLSLYNISLVGEP